ncbi:MAG: hypothetical protein JWQ02_4622 [Capsulimonas sp.]|nr:hypothetical protein [Capsulimonas sp.]
MAISRPSRWLPKAVRPVIFFLVIFATPAIVMSVHDAPIRARVSNAPAIWRTRLQGVMGKKRPDVITLLNKRYDAEYSLGDTSRDLYPGPKRMTKSDYLRMSLGSTMSPPFVWSETVGLTYDRQGRLVAYSVGVSPGM